MDSVTGAPLVARFQFTKTDSRAFGAIAQGRTDTSERANRKSTILMSGVMLVGASLPFLLNPKRGELLSGITEIFQSSNVASILGLVLPLIVFGAFWTFLIVNQKRAQKAMPAWNEPSTITLDETSVTQQAGAFSNRIEWRGFQKVVATGDHLCLFTTDNDGFVVPRRAFDCDDAWQRYVNFARQHWQKTQPAIPPIANA